MFDPSLADTEYAPTRSGGTMNVQLNAPVASVVTELPVGEVPTVQPVNATENGATGVSVTVARGRKSVPDATTAAPTNPAVGDNWKLNGGPDTLKPPSTVFDPSLADREYAPTRSGGTMNVQLKAPVASVVIEPPLWKVPTLHAVSVTENGAAPVTDTVAPATKSVPATVTDVPTGPPVGVRVRAGAVIVK